MAQRDLSGRNDGVPRRCHDGALGWSLNVADPEGAAGARRAFRAHLDRYAASESDVPGAELIFAELVANIMRHARGPASFVLDWHQARPTLFVLDRGDGICQAPRAFPEATAERGRGLALVNALAVQLRIGKRHGIGSYVCAILPVLRRTPIPAQSL